AGVRHRRVIVRVLRLASLVRAALRGIAASPLTSGVAVATIGVTLVLVGAFALLVANMQRLLADFVSALPVTGVPDDAMAEPEQRGLAEAAGRIEGVASARLVDQAEALARFTNGVGRGAALLEGLDATPLPASIELVLTPEQRSAAGLERVA